MSRLNHEDDNKQHKNLFLTKENSFRVYYRDVPSAVPFTWESTPGTPKHKSTSQFDPRIPPLTPPPSYSASNLPKKRSTSKLLLLHNLLRRMQMNPTNFESPRSNSSLSCSSSPHSSFSDPVSKRRRFLSWGSPSVEDFGKIRSGYSVMVVNKSGFHCWPWMKRSRSSSR